MIAKCKLADLVHDLAHVYNVSEIALDISGVGLAIADSLKHSGVKIISVDKFGRRI